MFSERMLLYKKRRFQGWKYGLELECLLSIFEVLDLIFNSVKKNRKGSRVQEWKGMEWKGRGGQREREDKREKGKGDFVLVVSEGCWDEVLILNC